MIAGVPSFLMLLPFVAMLAAIAIAPVVLKHHWERHYHKVSVGLGLIALLPYALVLRDWARIGHVAHEYLSFIALIGSLFVVVGGVHIGVKGEARPLFNCVFLLVGAIVSNVIGTTGASMLLVRPWIRINRRRFTEFHTVFFIFIVSNVGGCLTPIGDPPLLIGYLKGVPFWWVLAHCWKPWLVAVASLLAIFYFLDRRNFSAAPREIGDREPDPGKTFRLRGAHNAVFLAVILGAVFVKSAPGLREAIMLAAAAAAYFTTREEVRRANDFTFAPIKEVAWLFAGIFATMIPALDYLETHAASLGLHRELQFYWVTGVLSGVLDNAPTYLAMLAGAFALVGLKIDAPADMQTFLDQHHGFLTAISVAAVFFGAVTYIGNGPNLMVKSIAENAGVKTPGFFRYAVGFSLPVLLPLFWIIAMLFFSSHRIF